jgi:hypothetical protein
VVGSVIAPVVGSFQHDQAGLQARWILTEVTVEPLSGRALSRWILRRGMVFSAKVPVQPVAKVLLALEVQPLLPWTHFGRV